MICHIGSLEYGHYITINKDKTDIFYKYNDNIKTKISYEEFLKDDFFKKKMFIILHIKII